MPDVSSLTSVIIATAHEAGFDAAGIAPVRDFAELKYFPEWIAAGHAGEMRYLEARDEAGELKRASIQAVAPWARSVMVCALNYNTSHPYSTQVKDPAHGWISRYAWSQQDYHKVVMSRLRRIEAKLKEVFAQDLATKRATPQQQLAQSSPIRTAQGPELKTRCYVDTGPIVERVYAKYAGVGWIGKNTCILNQKLGSWLFLGVLLTSLELGPSLETPDRCGTCTRCVDACPTSALIVPYQLDSNRCIAYLTIEKRGAVPEEMRDGIGRHVFGCDICQDVCPWNRKAPVTAVAELQPREALVSPPLESLAGIDDEDFQKTFRGSPVRRAKRDGLRRNAVVAMGNSGNTGFLPKLRELMDDADPIVAEHARWAIRKLSQARQS